MSLRENQNFVAMLCCAKKILLTYAQYAARRFFLRALPSLEVWTFRVRNTVLLLCCVWLAACDEPRLPSPFHAAEVSGAVAQADFHLFDPQGQPRSLADYRGKIVLLFFGYVHCPDVCPTTLADIAQAMGMLGKEADKVQVLFVTVDPERDTRELLGEFVPAFDKRFVGLSGDMQATAQTAQAFGVKFAKQPGKTGYNIDHSAGTYLVDGNGRVRLLAPYGQRAEWLAQDVRVLLAMR